MIKGAVFLLVLFGVNFKLALGQELNCKVTINSQKLQTTEPRILQETLENSVFEFLNTRNWTDDAFKVEERIECEMFINVTDELGSDQFRATANIRSSRTAFDSDYNTLLLNFADKDWVFKYTEYLPLEFNENGFVSNLTSMLAFYAYIIIGLDYDSYSLYGGTPYFVKAQSIMNNVPANLGSDNAPGWKPFDGSSNRYWMVENLLNPKYKPVREAFYLYHIKGLDTMYDDPKAARQVILDCLKKIEKVADDNPNSMIVKLFFAAKGDELVKIFSGASPSEKATAVQLMYRSDPGNSSKYAKIMK